MSDERFGWEFMGRFYPHIGADGMWQGDYALIREVTGLRLDQFDRGSDPLATETGWLAVALWHGNPDMSRDQIVELVEKLPAHGDGIPTKIGWDTPEEADAAPLAPNESPGSGSSSSDSASPLVEGSSLSASPSTTKSAEDSTPDPSTRNGSGDPASATGAISNQPISDPSPVAAD